jgi:hypothetical protein
MPEHHARGKKIQHAFLGCYGRTLYITLVRPQMGYATQVWSPQTIDHIARLERAYKDALPNTF